MIDESRINPNCDKLYQHLNGVLVEYFKDNKPIPQYKV
jgi:hypothetical protein